MDAIPTPGEVLQVLIVVGVVVAFVWLLALMAIQRAFMLYARFSVWLPLPGGDRTNGRAERWFAQRAGYVKDHPDDQPGIWAARVDRIVDGDTLDVEDDYERGRGSRVRIAGIDAPSRHSDQGKEATAALEKLCPPGSVVWLRFKEQDRYHRMVCWVYSGVVPVAPAMIVRLHAAPWNGRGKSPLQKFYSPWRWLVGPPG